jgi:hypothetical protein
MEYQDHETDSVSKLKHICVMSCKQQLQGGKLLELCLRTQKVKAVV